MKETCRSVSYQLGSSGYMDTQVRMWYHTLLSEFIMLQSLMITSWAMYVLRHTHPVWPRIWATLNVLIMKSKTDRDRNEEPPFLYSLAWYRPQAHIGQGVYVSTNTSKSLILRTGTNLNIWWKTIMNCYLSNQVGCYRFPSLIIIR